MYFFIILLSSSVVLTEYRDCKGVRNEMPVLEIEPQLVGEVTNGKRWLVKDGDNFVHVAKVSGNAYEMGYALG